MDSCGVGEVTRWRSLLHIRNTVGSGVGAPSPWVMRFLGGVRPGGRILDVACGSGRHMRAALGAGLDVVGVDRDISGAADLSGTKGVQLIELDLETGADRPLSVRLGAGGFDGVIIANYLWRPILKDVVAMVGSNGILIYETFALGNERYGKPSNPDFLLKPGELLEAIRPDLTAIAYEHSTLSNPRRVVQRVVAAGREHRWLQEPPPL